MKEGWLGDQHFILFTAAEAAEATAKYNIASALPGFTIVGLRGWDDLIVKDRGGSVFAVPAVPIDAKYLEPAELPDAPEELELDERLAGKIKWYLTPLVFGGDAESEANIRWVTHEQHQQLVTFWNQQYRGLKGTPA